MTGVQTCALPIYERVEEFNKAVFEVLDSCDKRLRQDVIKKLNERKGIYAALK